MEAIINLLIFLVLIGLGYFVGSHRERKHFQELDRREKELAHILQSGMKHFPPGWTVENPKLVIGSVVIATDYFKVVASSLRNLFGGRIESLSRLAERARREAVVRMLEQAQLGAANVVWCIRIETSVIGGQAKGKAAGVEVTVYGTAAQIS